MLINGEKLSTNVEKSNVKRLNVNSSKEENVKNVKRLNVNSCSKAKFLVDKFRKLGYDDADGCYNYFVKCFNNLSENTVWEIYESVVNNPNVQSKIKYFIGFCRNKMMQTQ